MSKHFQNCKLVGVQVDPEKYHTQAEGVTRGDPRFVMSRSELMLFAQNPEEWLEHKEKKSSALDFGSLVDCLLLDKDRVKERFAFQPATYYNEKDGEDKPWNGNATVCKEWKKDHEGMQIVCTDDKDEAEQLMSKLMRNPIVVSLLKDANFQVHVTGEWHDRETGIVVPIQTLIDIVPSKDGEYRNALADFKTSRNLVPRLWQKDVHKHHYEAQGWLALELYTTATGEPRCEFRDLISKNEHPYTIGFRLLTSENINVGQLKIVNALRLYCQCLKEQKFPSFEGLANIFAPEEKVFDGWLTTSPENWMENALLQQSWGLAMEQPETKNTESDDIIP